jgi:hypothetical protein
MDQISFSGALTSDIRSTLSNALRAGTPLDAYRVANLIQDRNIHANAALEDIVDELIRGARRIDVIIDLKPHETCRCADANNLAGSKHR